MKARIYMDGDHEMILVPLLMKKENFDALVRAGDGDLTAIPVGSISIAYDEAAVEPVARLLVNSPPEMKEIQKQMGFHTVEAHVVDDE